MSDELSTLHIVLAVVVTVVAYSVKGFTGFGSGVVMVPVLTLFMPLKLVVFAACACAVANGAALAVRAWSDVDWRAIGAVFVACVLGQFVGTRMLVSLRGEHLKVAFGALVCFFAVRMLWQETRVQPEELRPWPAWVAWLSGLVGGIILGLYGCGGPAMVVYLAHRLRAKHVLRSSLIVLFFLGDVIRFGGYVAAKIMTPEGLWLSVFVVPAAIGGGYLGTVLQHRVNARTFRLVVASLLLGIGALMVLSTR